MGLSPLRQLERANPSLRQAPAPNPLPPHLQQFEARQSGALTNVLQDSADSVGPPRPNDGPDLGKLGLDLTQLGLDIVGIFEPTPFADLTNTGISLIRGDFFGAGLSALGVVPYVGDTAKLGKLGKWAKTVADAVDAAASNPAARRALEPALRKIADAIGSAPRAIMDNLPKEAREQLTAMKTKIDDLLRRNGPDDPIVPGKPYTQGDYDAYVARKQAAGETPRTPEEYANARDHWRRGGEAHQAVVRETVETLRARFPDADIIETPSLFGTGGRVSYPDVMVIDGDQIKFFEIKTGNASLTTPQRELLDDLENATFTRAESMRLGLEPGEKLGDIFEGGVSWETINGPGYGD